MTSSPGSRIAIEPTSTSSGEPDGPSRNDARAAEGKQNGPPDQERGEQDNPAER